MARKHCLPQNLTEYDQAFIGQLNYVGGKKAIDQYCEKSTFHLLRTSPQFRSDRFNTINFKLPKDLTCLRPIMGEIENHYN